MPHPTTFEGLPFAEQQEFQDTCERQRYNRKEFEVMGLEGHDGTRVVTVTRHGSGNSYRAGEDHNWLADFDDDLVNGYFGMP